MEYGSIEMLEHGYMEYGSMGERNMELVRCPHSLPCVQVITKDSNVMVVAVAGNIVAGLATGLRKSFQSYAPSVSTLYVKES